MKKKLLFILLTVLLITLILLKFLSKKVYHGVGVSGALVFEKQIEDNNHYIFVNHFNTSVDDIITVKIKVDDENVWNLIQTNYFYSIFYSNEKSEDYVLYQIQYTDKRFAKNNGDKFINYTK